MAKRKKKGSGNIAIVVSRFNPEVTTGLQKGAMETLMANGFKEENITILHVPGAFEIPLAAKQLCRSGKYCGVICLGAVIKGDTAHFEYISESVAYGLMKLNLEMDVPVSFGVLTCYNDEQAEKRSADDEHNKGREAAAAVIEMIGLLKDI